MESLLSREITLKIKQKAKNFHNILSRADQYFEKISFQQRENQILIFHQYIFDIKIYSFIFNLVIAIPI